jgi:gliding motility-associated-like protein
MFPDSGSYTITQLAINEFGCLDSTSKNVYVQIGYKLYVPTAFTPNEDGYNDVFRAFGEDIEEFSMRIYDRWGELLYSTFDIDNGWDGKTRLSEKTLPGGIYIYKIQAVDRNGLKNSYEGTLTLLR